jgi:hypothetical protein
MLRQNKQVVRQPNDPAFESVPAQLTINHRQQKFRQCDTGEGEQTASLTE